MKPTELRLFTKAEQTMLVNTRKKNLDEMSEEEIDELFTRVRRARNKYLKLYRRQSRTLVVDHESRAGTDTSNQPTLRKAEIFEDALAVVARALAAAAKTTSKQIKEERLALAAAAKGSPWSSDGGDGTDQADPSSAQRKPVSGRATSKSRQASRKSSGARNQAKRDQR